MKKSLLIISAAIVLFSSCKKKETNEFEAKDTTGTTNISGLLTKSIGGFVTPAVGVTVQVKVNNYGAGGLYPNVTTSGAYGSEVYYATSNASGKYSVNIKTNGLGVTANLVFKGFQGAQDTSAGAKVFDFPSSVATFTLIKGVDVVSNNLYTGSVSSQPSQNGLATVRGKILKGLAIHTASVGAATSTYVPIGAGVTVYCEYDMDPFTFTKKVYTTTTDANGNYSFSTIRTPNNLGLTGFNYNAKIYVNDMNSTYDTIRFDGTISTGIRSGVYSSSSNSTGANQIYSNVIYNSFNLSYGTFIND